MVAGKIVQPYKNSRLHHHHWAKLERWLCFPPSVSSLNYYYLSFHYTCIHIKGSSFVLFPGRNLEISVIRRRKMGTEGLLRSKELRQYMLETSVYPREPEILKELRNVTATHPWAAMLTDPDAAQMLALLLEITNAKKTIEIGVFTGYSLLLTALTLPQDGKIIAIDPDQDAFDLGLPFLKKAGVEHKINFINSVAHPVLDELLQNPEELESFDFAFVDADKECYAQYHEKLLKLVKPGGIIVYDNTLWHGTVAQDEESIPEHLRESARCIKELNKLIAADTRVHICQLPSGDGMTICRRL